MEKLLNKAITISGKEEKLQGGKTVIKIKDENNLTYTVYKTKQDGSTSVAWTQLQDLNLGDTVQIGYSETFGEYEGKKVTYRSIRNFNKDIGQGMLNTKSPVRNDFSASDGNPNLSTPFTSDGNSKPNFDKRITLYGMVNGRLSAGATIEAISEELPQMAMLVDEINEIASRPASMNKAQVQIRQTQELPVIQQEDVEFSDDDVPPELDVSSIPF